MHNTPHLDCNCVECVTPRPVPSWTPWSEWSAMIERGLHTDKARRKHCMPYNWGLRLRP